MSLSLFKKTHEKPWIGNNLMLTTVFTVNVILDFRIIEYCNSYSY